MRFRPIVISGVAALVLLGCGGTGSGQPTDGGEPPAPTDAAAPTEDQGSGSGSGGASGGSVPAIANGDYTSGAAHVELSGDKDLAFDADLLVGLATTLDGASAITYTSPDGASFQLIVDPSSGAGVSVSAADLFVAGGGCQLDLDRNDDSGIAGTLTCDDAPGFTSGGAVQAIEDIKATFTADR
ncbi:MAG: hypothetical protein ACHQ02_01365 [Candidatus Limnocylindrales bacterium]|jgi:hypothetical protein